MSRVLELKLDCSHTNHSHNVITAMMQELTVLLVRIVHVQCLLLTLSTKGYGSRFVIHSVHRAIESSVHFFVPVTG